MADSLRPVPVGACRCPGAPHADGDVVSLHPELGLDGGLAAQAAMWIDDPVQRGVALYGAMLDHGIAEWTFVDHEGNPEPITPAAIRRLLPWQKGGAEVSHAASAQFGASVTAPFMRQLKAASQVLKTSSSPTGRTEGSSTSRTSGTRSKRRKR